MFHFWEAPVESEARLKDNGPAKKPARKDKGKKDTAAMEDESK